MRIPLTANKRGSFTDWQLSCSLQEIMQISHQVTKFLNTLAGTFLDPVVSAGISISPAKAPLSPCLAGPKPLTQAQLFMDPGMCGCGGQQWPLP